MRGLITTAAILYLLPTLIGWFLWAYFAISLLAFLIEVFGWIGQHIVGVSIFALLATATVLFCFSRPKTAFVTIAIGGAILRVLVHQ